VKEERKMTVDTATPAPSTPSQFSTMLFNIVFSLLLRSPLHGLLSNRFILLSFKGRKSGKQYSFPVGYQREGNELQIISPRGWWKNLRGGNVPVTVLLKGRYRSGVAEAFHNDEVVVDAFHSFVRQHPSLIRRYHLEQDANGEVKRESVRRGASYIALVRIRLTSLT
jgi:F420H(2)-dependent quinone reductase